MYDKPTKILQFTNDSIQNVADRVNFINPCTSSYLLMLIDSLDLEDFYLVLDLFNHIHEDRTHFTQELLLFANRNSLYMYLPKP